MSLEGTGCLQQQYPELQPGAKVTSEQRILSRGLIVMPPRGSRQISKEEFLRRFPSAIERGGVAVLLFQEAELAKNAEDLQCALIIGHSFGFLPELEAILCRLLDADWHQSHEDLVSALDHLRLPGSVEALFHATEWVPAYLDYDESRALAVKAIWVLGSVGGQEAVDRLERLGRSDDPILREAACGQLDRLARRT